MQIVFLRYGSLVNPDVTKTIMSAPRIAAKLRMPTSSVQRVLWRFISRGHNIQALIEKKPRNFSRALPQYAQDFLLSPETLQQWQSYSLRERVLLLGRLFGLTIGINTLYCFYKAHNIAYLTAGRCYDIAVRQRVSLDSQRRTFAQLLGNVIVSGRGLLYVDESSFTNWSIAQKSWVTRGDTHLHCLPNTRFSVTVYACVSPNALNGLVYDLYDRTTN